jgi:hypothetical protein
VPEQTLCDLVKEWRTHDVTITRDSDCARIEYKERGIPVAHLEIGPEIAGMSDEKILEAFNECSRNEAKLAAKSKYAAVETPLGAAQIEYFSRCDQWVPRGGVLRCLIQDNEHGQLTVNIDGQTLSLKQFGKLLTTYAGWGMRIESLPFLRPTTMPSWRASRLRFTLVVRPDRATSH